MKKSITGIPGKYLKTYVVSWYISDGIPEYSSEAIFAKISSKTLLEIHRNILRKTPGEVSQRNFWWNFRRISEKKLGEYHEELLGMVLNEIIEK